MSRWRRFRSWPLWDALVRAPVALGKLSGRAWFYLFLYLGLCTALLGTTATLLTVYKDDFRGLVLRYLFPDAWQDTASTLIDYFFGQQLKGVIVNATIGASLLLVMVVLFPLKEALSHRFERDAHLVGRADGANARGPALPGRDAASTVGEPVDEFPLWFQAWEETKLFLLFVAVQGSIFWIGYHPSPVRKQLALVLSYLFLFFSFAIDFISPIVQRHRGRFSVIIKALATRPLSSLAFGGLFSLMPLTVGWIWQAHPEMSFGVAIFSLFAANVLAIAWAAVAGTWLGARWLDRFAATRPSRLPMRLATWLALVLLLLGNAYAFGVVGRSLHHKSQVLKCHYRVDWSSFGFERPGWLGLLGQTIDVGVHIDVDIENPTPFLVNIENNRVDVRHDGQQVATTELSPFAVEPGRSSRERLSFTLALSRDALLHEGRELLSADGWQIILYVEVASGFWFPIYLWPPLN